MAIDISLSSYAYVESNDSYQGKIYLQLHYLEY